MKTENKERKSNKVRRLVYSGILPLCAAIAVIFAVFRTDASDENKIQYLQRSYEAAGKVPEDTPEGYLFGGWYTKVGDEYTAVTAPELNETYYAKFVPEKVLDIKAQVTNDLIEKGEADNVAIRFVTSIDSLDYQKIGFRIQKGTGVEPKDAETTNTVYEKLYAVEATKDDPGQPLQDPDTAKEYTAADLFHRESQFFKTWTIRNIPVYAYDADITVTPYWETLDGTRVDGTTSIKTVNLGRSWVYLDASANADAKTYGTKEHPFTKLEDALNAILVKNGKITVANSVQVSDPFQWEANERVGTIAITGEENKDTPTLDFSKVSNLGIYDAVTFTNIKLELASEINVTVSAGGSVAIGQETEDQMQLKIIPDDKEKPGTVKGSKYADSGEAYFKGDANCTLRESSTINVNFEPNDSESVATAFEECEVRIEDIYYATLKTAVDLAKTRSDEPTVTLVKDCTLEETHLAIGTGNHLNLCLDGKTLTGAEGQRVFVLSSSTAELSIYDGESGTGTIEGNNSSTNGGVVFLNGGTLNLYGGTLKQLTETAGANGMVIKVGQVSNGKATPGTFNMYGGTITDSNAAVTGGGVYVNKESTFNMSGGTIEKCSATTNGGGVYVADTGKFTLSGDAKITGNTVKEVHNNVYLETGATFTVGELSEEAYVGITAAAEADTIGTCGVVPEGTLFSDDHNKQVLSKGEELTIGDSNHCVCGGILSGDGDHTHNTDTEWKVWDGKSGNGRYYLEKDITIAEITIKSNMRLELCLNGHTVTGTEGNRVFVLTSDTAELSICDCRKGGTIEVKNITGNGGVVFVQKGTINLFGGTLKQLTETAGSNGMVIRVGSTSSGSSTKGIFNMYGGTITGGNITTNGGGVLVSGTESIFNMYGGTITGCNAGTNGGGVCVQTGNTFNMYGGTITGCNAGTNGGGVYIVGGSFTLSGAPVITGNTKGELTNNVYLVSSAEFKVGKLSEGALVGITAPNDNTEIGTAEEDPGNKLVSDNGKKTLSYNDGKLTLTTNSDNGIEE